MYHPRRVAIVEGMKRSARRRVDALHTMLLFVEEIDDILERGGDEALDDLSIASAAICCRA